MNAMDHLFTVRRRVLGAIQAAPAVRRLFEGRPSRETYKVYLTNVWHYAQHSTTVIGLAGTRCVRDNPPLADYLLHHAREELGHEKWALEDLAAIGVDKANVLNSRPLPSCAAMIGYEYYVAGHANPVGLFGWLYVLEAMGEDLGPIVSERLSITLGPSAGVRFVRGHGEADEAHTKDLAKQITTHVRSADLGEVNHVAEVVARLYVGIFEELPIPS
jgi:pyrroloquinoline quinone (PQQ) biosynthesis protein C